MERESDFKSDKVWQSRSNEISFSKCVHHLVNISLQKGNTTNADSKEDAFEYYQDTLSMLDNLKVSGTLYNTFKMLVQFAYSFYIMK